LKITKLLLVFFLVTIISVFSLLFSGIKIDSFSFGNINVSQFYIKLDKKLIVDIDNIEIKSKKSKVENSYDDLQKNIDLLPKVLKFFKSIHVERLKIDGNEFTISMNDKAIYLDNKFVNLSSRIEFLAHQVVFDLYSLYLKDVNLMLDGKVKIDYFNEKLDVFGNYYYEDLEGEIKVEMTEKLAQFYLNSQYFKSLKFIKKFIRLDSVAEEWMYDNVKGNIKLDEFYGQVDLVKKAVIEKSLRGKAHIDKAKIEFHKDAKKIDTKRVDVTYEKDRLSFNLIKPVYEGIKIDGSNVVINNLTSEQKGEVVVDIRATAKLDDRILGILKAYEINLPVKQEAGLTKAKVVLGIPYLISRKMTTKGTFSVGKSKIKINDFEFFTDKANVILDGPIVRVKDSHFKIDKLLDSKINLDIDTRTLKADGDAIINKFEIKTEDTNIVNLSGVNTPIMLDFNKDTFISLSNLSTNIRIDKYILVNISKLSQIYKSSQLLQELSIKDGNLVLQIKDESDLSFKGNIKGLDFPLEKNGNKINSLDILGKVKGDNIKVSSRNKDINVEIKNKKLYIALKNLALVINTKEEGSGELLDMNLNGENIKLKLNDEIYSIVKANAKIKNKNVKFDGIVKDLDIPILKNGKKIKLLSLDGFVKDDSVELTSSDKKIKLKYNGQKKLEIYLDGYDLAYNTKEKNETDDINILDLKAVNSNLIVNEKYKFIADNYELRLREDSKFFHLAHKKSDITFKENEKGEIDIFANDISSEMINSIFDKKILNGGKMMLLSKGDKKKLKGKMILTNVKVEDLAILNNLLLFIHSSPALVNPLLAIPSVVGMASNKGFNLTGYQIADGVIEYSYDRDLNKLDIKKLVTVGNGIDFEGAGNVDINTSKIDANIKMIFFKDYSKIVGAIPVVNYVLLGKNKRVSTQVKIFGTLEEPKYSTNLTKDAFSVPLNIGKRIIQSPVKIFDIEKQKDNKKEQNKIEQLKQKLKQEENKNKELKKEFLDKNKESK